MKRSLSVKKETLSELTGTELTAVVGGEAPTIRRCDDLLTGMYPTLPLLSCVCDPA